GEAAGVADAPGCVFGGADDGELAGDGFGAGEADGGASAPPAAGEAAGVADAPGCVFGGAGGGLTAAAGWPRLSELGPATEVAFGVPLGTGEADDAGVGAVAADACASGVLIWPAGASFFLANSATLNSMARVIGMRARPLFLSIQP